MKKHFTPALLSSIFIINNVYAITCTKIDADTKCNDMGYTCTAEQCSGASTLSCPLDLSKKFCFGKPVECTVGSLLYQDLQCYNTTCGAERAIGVVFDATNRLAISKAYSWLPWASSNTNISSLTDCSTADTAKTTCNTSGKTNSQTITSLGGDYINSSYAPGWCYNRTTGGVTKGSWFLPSIKEWTTIYNNKTAIGNAMSLAGGENFTSKRHWSSNEKDASNVWVLYMYDGTINTQIRASDSVNVRCAIKY